MNIQTVHKVEIFDQTPARLGSGTPRYVVLVHFSELALQMIRTRKQNANLSARKIAKSLTRNERLNIENGPGGGSRITHPSVDLDTLGEPNACPDDAGSRVWVTVAPEGSMYQTVSARA
jgi:hypothetical protein